MSGASAPPFVHLHVHSAFSRLAGADVAETLVARAAALEQEAIALTDVDTLSGVVPFLQACARHGVRAILGAEVTLGDGAAAPPGPGPTQGSARRPAPHPPSGADPPSGGGRLVLLAPDADGYSALCRLISRAHLDHPRGRPAVDVEVLEREAPHLFALSGGRTGDVTRHILGRHPQWALQRARLLAGLFGPERFFLELPADRLPGNRRLVSSLRELGDRLGMRTVAAGDVYYAGKERAWVADLLACVRLGCRVDDLPVERAPGTFNGERHLKSGAEVAEATGDAASVAAAAAVAAACRTPLELGRNRYPRFATPDGRPALQVLREAVEEGARRRYGEAGTAAVRPRLEYELGVIGGLGFADYFLCVADVVSFARARGIRVAGRGSAADSAVAYVLGITDVDAAGRGHLFERFLSAERAEAPDIDLDFDSRRRDEVADYVVRRYGRGRVCAVGAHNTFDARSAVREIGKALGFPAAELDALAKRIPYYVDAAGLHAALREVPELRDVSASLRSRLPALILGAAAVAGLPRHLSTHLGGLCITPGPVTDVLPVQRAAKVEWGGRDGVIVGQWDKRDLEAAGLLKLDLLSLRTLGAVDDALRLAAAHASPIDYERIPEDDPATFARLRRGATIGVFQLESAAQQALQVRLGAERMEDVIASVALIRPGPIKGDMVEPFVRRRLGREAVTYPAPGLEDILGRTFGVVVYQEQVIAIASAVAGFSPGESDRLRRVMSHARSAREMEELGRLFLERAAARGTDPQVASGLFRCLQGYASYGFPEAHAVAFGMTAYRTAYLAEHAPAPYFAGLLGNQPMGFYPVGTLVGELRRRGVTVLGPDCNRSGRLWDEEGSAGTGGADAGGGGAAQAACAGGRCLRAPLTAVRGLPAAVAAAIVAERERGGPYRDLFALCRRVPAADVPSLESLVLAGACDGLGTCGQNRRALLWSLSGIREAARAGGLPLGLPPAPGAPAAASGPAAPVPEDFSPRELWLQEVRLLGFSPRGHLMSLLRAELNLEERGCLRTGQARSAPDGERVTVAGLPVRPHRPPTRSGRRLVFVGLEDEEGLVEVLVPEEVYLRDGACLFPAAPLLEVEGRVRRRGTGMSLAASGVRPLGPAT